jgi:uncharacterized membrane protein
MKFFSAIVVYLLIGALLGWGILLAVKGNYWLLAGGLLAYLITFAKMGCLPPKHH